MKESIFKLKKEEIKTLEKELYKTAHLKNYIKGYILVVALFGIPGMFLLPIEYNDTTYIYWITYLMMIMGFITLFSLIYYFKTLDLMKMYYDENKKTNN